ncbi:Alcohol dehydrogenase, C-terminal [Cynara cardunculus var. scolymus]|uniref:Alcohol dehydrogenase, C-terminal n=1 Tax=Cynara cardunculus var. scolymus TaxID=59895 RepID=A0A103XC27_CYNCS|nr:Alcohol dehydrogenase, C-terminal [Cynara cardunculus var. scolymus]
MSSATTRSSSFVKNPGGVIKCKAAVAWGAGEPMVMEEVEVSPPQPSEIRIKVVSTSLCRSDVTAWLSQAQPPLFPRIFGHEASGADDQDNDERKKKKEEILDRERKGEITEIRSRYSKGRTFWVAFIVNVGKRLETYWFMWEVHIEIRGEYFDGRKYRAAGRWWSYSHETTNQANPTTTGIHKLILVGNIKVMVVKGVIIPINIEKLIVESVGLEVTEFVEGDHVLTLFIGECMSCRQCISGRSNICQQLGLERKGVMHSDQKTRFFVNEKPVYHYCAVSSFSEYTVVHSGCAVKISKVAPLEKVCLLSCGTAAGKISMSINEAVNWMGSSKGAGRNNGNEKLYEVSWEEKTSPLKTRRGSREALFIDQRDSSSVDRQFACCSLPRDRKALSHLLLLLERPLPELLCALLEALMPWSIRIEGFDTNWYERLMHAIGQNHTSENILPQLNEDLELVVEPEEVLQCRNNQARELEVLICWKGLPSGHGECTAGLGAAWNVADVSKGSTVAIFGLGTVGLSVAQGAKIRGASRIIGVDTNPEKNDKAKAFGVTDFINPNDIDETVQQVIKRLTDGGADYCFECIGDTEMINTALHSCCDGWGMTVTLGVPKTKPDITSHYGLFLTGRTLKGSLFGGWKPKSDVPSLIDKYLKEEIKIDELITHNLPFTDINKAFDLMVAGNCLRCVIHMPNQS